jgi:hypothetical protein
MTKEEFIGELLAWLKSTDDVEFAGRIDGEDTVGVEMADGAEYFIEINGA